MEVTKIKPTSGVKATERECEICGIYFEVTHHRQKYCPDCRTHSEKKKAQMEKNIQRSIKMHGPIYERRPIHCTCDNCGASFDAFVKKKHFCSRDCKIDYELDNTKCGICGKTKREVGTEGFIVRAGFLPEWYCSEEHALIRQRQLGRTKNCPHCGKEFVADTKFCSSECRFAHMSITAAKKRAEKANPIGTCKECGKEYVKAESGTPHFNTKGFCCLSCRRVFYKKEDRGFMRKCEVCGKTFFKSADELMNFSDRYICSEECYDKVRDYERRKWDQYKEETAKAKAVIAEAKAKKKEKAKEKPVRKTNTGIEILDPAWVEKNGLCGICRTPYKKCQLMQTNFRVKPEGAVYHDSKIVSCPCFTN